MLREWLNGADCFLRPIMISLGEAAFANRAPWPPFRGKCGFHSWWVTPSGSYHNLRRFLLTASHVSRGTQATSAAAAPVDK